MMSTLLVLATLLGSARAAEPVSPEGPAAESSDRAESAPPVPMTTPAPDRPLAVPAGPQPAPLTAARLQAIRSYKAGRLELREETELRGGSAWVMGSRYGGMWGPGYGAWGWAGPVIVDPPTAVQTWGIYRGPQRLDVPDFLSIAGEAERKRQLDAGLERLRRRGTGWSVVAGLGGAGLVTGLVGMSSVENRRDFELFNSLTLGSTLLMATGFIGTSFPRGRESALRRYPAATLGSDEAQQLVDRHNEMLRTELGLSAADVWALEAG